MLAFGVVVSEQDADQIERTNDAISRLGLIWRGLSNQLAVAAAPALEAVANAMAAIASRTGPLGIAIRGLFDNIGRLTTYAVTFATFLAGRWVAGLAAAALSVRGFATALVVLRGALIRTGIGALIVGVGELIYQLSQFVARVGGVGEAFRLLSDLASEVWSRIGLALDAVLARMAAGWEGLRAAALSALDGTVAGVVGFGDRTVAIFQGAYDGAVAIWGSLPGAIGDFAYTLPNTSSELAILGGIQTFTGNKTFSGTLTASGTVTVSAAIAAIGTATGTATYGMGTGATTTGLTKTVNLGTGGASGSNTVVNIGPATSGANGTTVVNTPTVTFANAVTQVGMPQANLTAQLLGLGGATADSYNRLSVNTPAVLLNNAGAGIEATVNKAAAGNDAAFAFKTGFSARALIGLLGSDDFSFKVSPDGSAFYEAIRIDRSSGRVEMPEPMVLPAVSAVPAPPPTGKLALYARDRAGAGWLDVQRPSGRFFPLQPHFGVNRIATWAPSTGTTVNTNGMPRTAVGTVATPPLATTNLSTSMRRWRVTSAATADAAAEERSAGWVCWRGNADGLGGFTYVNRLSLVTLQATGMGFFGL